MTSSFSLIFLIILCILSIVIILLLIGTAKNKGTDSSSFELRINQIADAQREEYEKSTERLLLETRRQYESQISQLETRLHEQNIELRRLSAIEFENLANKALKEHSDRLAEENRDDLNTLLSPLKENLKEFSQAVTETYVKGNSAREAILHQLDLLIISNSKIGEEARRLSDALRGNTRLQGVWGERILEKLLDNAGFVKNVNYIVQASNADGRRISDENDSLRRPDLIFLLPDSQKIVIDSKTSMTAYLNYCDASTEEEERNWLKAHIDSVKRHIDKLGRTQYHKLVDGAMEHTLMFMPNDGAYLAALRTDPFITDYALRKNVTIVAPTHLLSILNLISQLWRVDKQNRNAEEIARLGGLLYDKIASFFTDFESIKRNLDNADKAYEKSLRTLSDGSTSISARARKLKEMGAKTSKNISST